MPESPRPISHKKRRLTSIGPRASQACRACAASKVRCDDRKICHRCQKKTLTCIRAFPCRTEPPTSSPEDQPDGSVRDQRQSSQRPVIQDLQTPLATCHSQSRPHGTAQSLDNSTASPSNAIIQSSFEIGEATSVCKTFPRGVLTGALGSEFCRQDDPCPDVRCDPSLFDGLFQASDAFNVWSSIAPLDASEILVPDVGWDFFQTYPATIQSEFNVPAPAPAPEAQEQVLSPVSPISRTGEVAGKILTAYKTSLGNWNPDQLDYLSAEERDLFVHSKEIPDAKWCPLPRHYNDQIFTGKLSFRSRDQIMTMVVNLISPSHVPACVSAFPSSECLERLAKVFLTRHKSEQGTFIHIPTFEPSECDPVLFAACSAAGGVRSTSPIARKYGFALIEVVRLALCKRVRNCPCACLAIERTMQI